MAKPDKNLKKVLPHSRKKAPLVLITEIIIGITFSILSLLLFAYITQDVMSQKGVSLDNELSQAVYSYRSNTTTEVMHAISFLGNEFIMLSSAVIILILALKKYRREATFFFLTISLGFILNLLLKYLLKVPRPTIDPLIIESFYSFPSGHSMNSFIFYGTLAYLTYHLTHNKTVTFLAILASSLIIFLIGVSRIYLGVHNPSDVLGGFIAGFWWLVTAILIDKTLTFYKIHALYRK